MTDDEVAAQSMTDDDVEAASKPVAAPKRPFLSEVATRARAELEPLAHLSLPTSLSDAAARVKQNIQPAVEAAKGLGRGALAAAEFPGRVLLHPADALEHAGATGNEVLRGAYGNVPLLNLVNERAFGVPETSPEDAAAAVPGAREFGALATPLGPKAAEGAAGVAGRAASSTTEVAGGLGRKALARSIQRHLESGTPIRDAVVKALEKGAEHGHLGLTSAVARGGLVAADEAAAGLARRLGMKAVEAPTPAVTPAPPPATVAPAVSVAPAAPPAEPAAPPTPASPQIEVQPAPFTPKMGPLGPGASPQVEALRAALKDADPKQAKDINAALAKIAEADAAKAARVGPKPAPAAPASGAAGPFGTGARPDLWGGRPPPPSPLPRWTPGPKDETFAKKLGVSLEDYRRLMVKRDLDMNPETAEAVRHPDVALARLVDAAHKGQGKELLEHLADRAVAAGASREIVDKVLSRENHTKLREAHGAP